MIKFEKNWVHGMCIQQAIVNGTAVAEYRVTDSAIDDGIVEVLAGEIPLTVALWATSLGITNNSWFDIREGYLYNVEVDRYTI